MNRKHLCILSFSLILSAMVRAQDGEIQYQQLTGSEYTDPGLTNKGIYLNEEFVPGCILMNSGDIVTSLYLRYNIHSGELIWLTKEYGQVKLDQFIIREFSLTMKDTTIHFRQLRLPEADSVPAFYQELYRGQVTLLVQRKVAHASNYYRNKIHFSEYKPNPQYYLIIGEKIYHPSHPTIKSIYTLFPGLKEQIQHQVRTRHLQDRNEKDFVEFVREVEEIFVKN